MIYMSTPTITIDMDKECKQCGRKGAAGNGICMKCILKNMRAGKYDHLSERARKESGIKKKS